LATLIVANYLMTLILWKRAHSTRPEKSMLCHFLNSENATVERQPLADNR
jgi:hypothetical protein